MFSKTDGTSAVTNGQNYPVLKQKLPSAAQIISIFRNQKRPINTKKPEAQKACR
jgi:hypothetical protein